MLELFKGQATLKELMYDMPLKVSYRLREARVNRLIKEREAMDKGMKQQESANIRNAILAK